MVSIVLCTTTDNRDILHILSLILAILLQDTHKYPYFIKEETELTLSAQNHRVNKWKARNSNIVLTLEPMLFLVKLKSMRMRSNVCLEVDNIKTTSLNKVELCVQTAMICYCPITSISIYHSIYSSDIYY